MKVEKLFKNITLVFISLLFVFLILEIICRIFVDFDQNFYSSSKKNKSDKFIIHPYGKIPVNQYGFFDEEFNFKNNKEVIAYFGDSVTYGVGAGYPYRFTEYLDKINSQFEHINLSGGLGISLNNWNKEHETFLLENNIRRVVYVMNLNDIAPLSQRILNNNKNSKSNLKNINFIKKFIKPFDDYLRGPSVFYTYLRFLIKNQLVKAGYESSGYEAIEFFSKKNKKNIIEASKKIDQWLDMTKKKGLKSCVIILPYEMQISNDAKNYYQSINIKFEKDFSNFSTQKTIKNHLKNYDDFFIIDKDGFEEKEIGYYFVFNKGDKIDFNHPNRNGHLSIAKEISKKKVCQG
tara:strand:+ start:4906 stop:5949 length:1044 start_codon:yes stop_codon:yes gene_type:complete